jgi:hypothetical protein
MFMRQLHPVLVVEAGNFRHPARPGVRLKSHQDRGTRCWQSGSGAHFVAGTSTCDKQKTPIRSPGLFQPGECAVRRALTR